MSSIVHMMQTKCKDKKIEFGKFMLNYQIFIGPPGTGKTFLGLKVAEVMLENSKKWNEEKQPILVVCYTNHALDQFMEGLLPHTSEIVRIGGQSKNDAVNAFNLKELRRGYKKWMYE